MTLPLFDIALRIVLVVATGILFTLVFAAYIRLRNKKLLFLSIGFGIFFAHALIYIPELFGAIYVIDENAHLVIHLIALIFIILSTLKD